MFCSLNQKSVKLQGKPDNYGNAGMKDKKPPSYEQDGKITAISRLQECVA